MMNGTVTTKMVAMAIVIILITLMICLAIFQLKKDTKEQKNFIVQDIIGITIMTMMIPYAIMVYHNM